MLPLQHFPNQLNYFTCFLEPYRFETAQLTAIKQHCRIRRFQAPNSAIPPFTTTTIRKKALPPFENYFIYFPGSRNFILTLSKTHWIEIWTSAKQKKIRNRSSREYFAVLFYYFLPWDCHCHLLACGEEISDEKDHYVIL